MPPIEHNGNLVLDDIDKAELFNKFFCEQSTLDDSDHTPPDLTELQTDGLRDSYYRNGSRGYTENFRY